MARRRKRRQATKRPMMSPVTSPEERPREGGGREGEVVGEGEVVVTTERGKGSVSAAVVCPTRGMRQTFEQ